MNGIRCGRGIYFHKLGSNLYDGEFKDGLPNGQGKYIFGNGDTYSGKFKDGKFHGKLVLFLC